MVITNSGGILSVLLYPMAEPALAQLTPLAETQIASTLLQDVVERRNEIHQSPSATIPDTYNALDSALASPFVFDDRRDSGPALKSP
jgi:hypothetical protein